MSATPKKTGPKTEPQDLITAAKTGDRLATLISLRDLLAERLQHTNSGRDVGSIARQLIICLEEIDALREKDDDTDDNEITVDKLRERYGI